MSQLSSSLEDRIAAVEERIAAAAGRAARARQDITLVAVTKKFSSQTIRDAYTCGLRHFGENYVQEFARKQPELGDLPGAHFHLIGHLQSNKARLATELFQIIQTIDSVKLLQRLDGIASESGKRIEAFFELRLSDEESKTGAAEGELAALVEAARNCRDVQLSGLMTVPPWSENAEESRPYFKRLAELARQYGLTQLSMGMSNDFEAAIEEGATVVRVGTALFGSRPKA